MEVIRVNNLYKTFKSKRKKVNALNGMSFTVNKGEILGFLGPNGAGKSTTIKIMMDLIRADRGSAKILGIDSSSPVARLKVGFMPENPQYYDTLTGYDLLMFSAAIFKVDKNVAKKRAWELLEEFELKDAAKRPIRKYSKGMIQRIGFASTLIHDPEILILDEPMSGLDPMGRVLFKNKMLELNKKGVTIFFSSHIIPDIEDICSRVLIVNRGKVVKSLEKTEIKYLTTTGFKVIIDNPVNIGLKLEKITDNLYSFLCPKNNLIDTLEKLKTHSTEIIDIEPVKKSLEDMFVEITMQDKTN
ncbi:ABC transporter ATP-binding protein [Deferribacter autotrophicus]|uniref:ABC transporter ATP-binding protein n=1 Tax=Deferribacter autotrophicus TaxID=500465 RepID=A0A5A8F7L3_9BACT|nr:ABC transporter ATP-binding protein [Deferribacter autotrophicus]KAA0259048.1 ABC transporter ATP-binding protein [Deferribacter autotrophicus]